MAACAKTCYIGSKDSATNNNGVIGAVSVSPEDVQCWGNTCSILGTSKNVICNGTDCTMSDCTESCTAAQGNAALTNCLKSCKCGDVTANPTYQKCDMAQCVSGCSCNMPLCGKDTSTAITVTAAMKCDMTACAALSTGTAGAGSCPDETGFTTGCLGVNKACAADVPASDATITPAYVNGAEQCILGTSDSNAGALSVTAVSVLLALHLL
jgi:hypothetical protein